MEVLLFSTIKAAQPWTNYLQYFLQLLNYILIIISLRSCIISETKMLLKLFTGEIQSFFEYSKIEMNAGVIIKRISNCVQK